MYGLDSSKILHVCTVVCFAVPCVPFKKRIRNHKVSTIVDVAVLDGSDAFDNSDAAFRGEKTPETVPVNHISSSWKRACTEAHSDVR